MAVESPEALTLLFVAAVAFLSVPSLHALSTNDEIGEIGRRILLSFKETPQGSNATFDCSPSGPCVPCQYSEKNEEKYRCSETGYRIPLKCVEIKDGSKDGKGKSSRRRATLEIFPKTVKLHTVLHNLEELASSLKHRRLLSDSSTQQNGVGQAYITYRSCIPAVNEEKLSVIDFEGIVFCLLLVSGSVVYVRKKRAAATSGFGTGRIQANSWF